MMKPGICPRCKKRRRSSHRDSYCSECRREYGIVKSKELREAGWKPKPPTSEQKRNYNLRRTHKLTIEGYAQILEFQGGVCAICGARPAEEGVRKDLFVDHDHKTKEVRGLLCPRCNLWMAAFDSEWFYAAARKYVASKLRFAFIRNILIR